ncbi:MAG: molybdopterin cofactor-binding domain-containing protein [Myxococcota bacterium]
MRRREFIQKTAALGSGLVLGTRLLPTHRVLAEVGTPSGAPLVTDPNAFLRIAPDNTVTVLIKHIEFGQGVNTGLTTLVAEELDADWSQMRAESAPSDPKLYLNYAFGAQGTGGSTAIANSYIQMRRVGATARAMLVEAAARRWKVRPSRIRVEGGVLRHGKDTARFGDLAESAMQLSPPKNVRLKTPKEFRLIGQDLRRPDTRAKSTGDATYTIDVVEPELLTVLIKRPERFGAKVKTFDSSAAESIEGFVGARTVPSGVAVYATGFWAAKRAREQITVEWEETDAETRGSEELIQAYTARLEQPGATAALRGQPSSEAADTKVLTADFVFPYLAHAPMEPLDIFLKYTESGGVQARFGSQLTTGDHQTIASVMGLKPERVGIQVLFGGGSFGRRAQGDCHLAAEGAHVLKASPGKRPVKVVWTREDDIKGGYYRPLYVHRITAQVGPDNRLTGWEQRIVGQSILRGTPFEAILIKDGIDQTSVEGSTDLPYRIPNFRVGLITEDVGVPVLWWRSVGSTHTGFSTETFIDEILEAMGESDQVKGRLALLEGESRHAGVLKAAAELADWPRTPRDGRAYGVALHKSFGTYVAQIAEVSISKDGMPKVHKVWCGVDCGVAVNPNIVTAQMEGGIGFGLGAALYNEIELERGRVKQGNFNDYLPLRSAEMPEVEVKVVASTEPPTGVGEPGVPVIAPAVANAYYRLTGKRIRRLPFKRAVARNASPVS